VSKNGREKSKLKKENLFCGFPEGDFLLKPAKKTEKQEREVWKGGGFKRWGFVLQFCGSRGGI